MKRALVTGASRGIGAALAKRIAKRGYEVWLGARTVGALEDVARTIGAEGGRAHAVLLDVGEPDATERAVSALDREVGGFDLVVANAGIGGEPVALAEQRFSVARRVIETNLLGSIATLLPVIPGMVERRSGHLVGVTSLAGEIPLPSAVDYGTSKAALSFFLSSAAADLIPRGIAVTDVRPGFVKTSLTDKNNFEMPFIVELERAADLIDRGIAARRRVVRFPLPLKAAITAGNLLPASLRDRIINGNRPF